MIKRISFLEIRATEVGEKFCKSSDVAELEKELATWKSEYLKVDDALKMQIDINIGLTGNMEDE